MNFVFTSEVVFNKFRCFWCVRQSRVIRSLASGTLRSVIVVVVVVVLIRVLLFLFLTTPHRCRVTLRCEQLCEGFLFSFVCVCPKQTTKKFGLILNFFRQPARQTHKVFKNSARSVERFDKDGDSGVLFERRGAFSSSS